MKFIGVILVLIINLHAGKVTWDETGSPTITGGLGEGCTQNSFGTEDKNATKINCH